MPTPDPIPPRLPAFAVENTALLLIDVINDFDFDGSAELLRFAVPAARRLAKVTAHLRSAGVPVIYVNDNFGRWRSDFREQIKRCTHANCTGREVAAQLLPAADDYFVLKPRHSGFYATALPVLLEELGNHRLVLAGLAGDICVLYTANDAYMRGFDLMVIADCTASETVEGNEHALKHMKQRLKASVVMADDLLAMDFREAKL